MCRHLWSAIPRLATFALAAAMAAMAHGQQLTKRIDNLPLYGQPGIERSPEMRRLDDAFIAEAVAGLGTRERASEAWWAEGERFAAAGNFDYAMRRYNEAWLLNPNSFKPYWGIARVLLESDRVEESKLYFSRAVELVDDRYQEPALLCDAANAHVFSAKQSTDPEAKRASFAEADALYAKALKLDPEYGNACKRYAMSLYYQGAYAKAWGMVHEAQQRPGVEIPPGFLEALAHALPEPAR